MGAMGVGWGGLEFPMLDMSWVGVGGANHNLPVHPSGLPGQNSQPLGHGFPASALLSPKPTAYGTWAAVGCSYL